MKVGDNIYCIKSFSVEIGPIIDKWVKGRFYKILDIDVEGIIISCEGMTGRCWLENEEWFDSKYESYENNFKYITEKEMRKLKLKEIEGRR